MIKRIVLFIFISFLLVGCSSSQEDTFKEQLEGMYTLSVRQVMNFMEMEKADREPDDLVEELAKMCETYIEEIGLFQDIEVPEEGKELYERVNALSMDLSDTLVMLTYSVEQEDMAQYNEYKDTLAFLFMEAGYVGEELQVYLRNENFVEEVMKEYQ